MVSWIISYSISIGYSYRHVFSIPCSQSWIFDMGICLVCFSTMCHCWSCIDTYWYVFSIRIVLWSLNHLWDVNLAVSHCLIIFRSCYVYMRHLSYPLCLSWLSERKIMLYTWNVSCLSLLSVVCSWNHVCVHVMWTRKMNHLLGMLILIYSPLLRVILLVLFFFSANASNCLCLWNHMTNFEGVFSEMNISYSA